MPDLSRFLALLAAPALFTGIASAASAAPPEGVPAAAQSLPAHSDGRWPEPAWWEGYGDAQLSVLVAEGLRNSPDMAAAGARFRAAAGMAGVARGGLWPSLDASGSVGAEKQSYNLGYPAFIQSYLPLGWQDTGQVAGQFSWEVDLWGKNRATYAAALSESRAAALDLQQARLLLTTGIVAAYVDLARLEDEAAIARREAALRATERDLVAERNANGLETLGALRQAEAALATAREADAAAAQTVLLRRHQLAALLGAGPDRALAIAAPALAPVSERGLPTGVTTSLISRRPDIAAARERMEAAAQRVKVARAGFYPSVSLSALVGMQSLGLSTLFDKGSWMGQAGPAVTLPVFHAGAIRSRYRGAKGEYDAAVAAYDGTVVEAYRQAADAATSTTALASRLAEARAAARASEDALAMVQSRRQAGLANALDVLATEDRLLTARRAEAEVEAGARDADVALVRALGGDFAPGAPASVEAKPLKDVPHG